MSAVAIEPETAANQSDKPPLTASVDDRVRDLLRQVIDPEVGVNIVDLGLVYRIDANASGVRVEMTMTSPACPLGEMIVDEARAVLIAGLPGSGEPDISLVWNPTWEPSMMSQRAKESLGWSE